MSAIVPREAHTPNGTAFDTASALEKCSIDTSRTNSKAGSEMEQSAEMAPLERRNSAMATLSEAPDPQQSVNDAPETWPTDWRAYTSLFGCFLQMFNSWGIVNAYGTYASYYMLTLLPKEDLLRVNLVGATQCFVILFLSAVTGRFLDAGHFKELLILGTFLLGLGSFLLSVMNGGGEYDEGNFGLIWLTQGFLMGLGMACFFVSSSQIAATWFRGKRKGFAIGIVASGASIAGLVYPLMARSLITKVGFNNMQRYLSTVTVLSCILAYFLARPNPGHQFRPVEKWSTSVFWDKSAFKHPPFMWLTASISILFFGFYAVFFNLEEWADSTGVGYKGNTPPAFDAESGRKAPMRTAILLAVMNVSSTAGRLGSASLTARYGPLNVHATVTLVASFLVFTAWTQAKTVTTAVVFVVLFGIFSGAVIGLPPASVADVLGLDDVEAQAKLGQWTGMMYSCAAPFALTGPVIAGHLISAYGKNFLTVQLWSGACMSLSAFCMLMAIYTKRSRDHGLGRSFSNATKALLPGLSRTVSRMTSRRTSEDEKAPNVRPGDEPAEAVTEQV